MATSTPPPFPSDTLARRLDARVHEEQASQRLPSLVAGVARRGRLAWWGSAGTTGVPGSRPPDAGTQYRIGSISKTFVAVSAMRLRDDGLLDLQDPVGRHLPELSSLPVTVAHLLSHTSGLPAETPPPWWERVQGGDWDALVDGAISPRRLLSRPGRRFHYSNVGYAVLGELVARVRARPLWDVIADELLAPLGMTRTTTRPVAPHADGLAVHPHADLVLAEPEHDAGAMAPAGQLWSTITDLARWSGVLSGVRPDVLGAETAAEMAEPLAVADLPEQPWSSAYGLGLVISNRAGVRVVGHGGAMPGFVATLAYDAASSDAVVACANSTYKAIRPELAEDLLALAGEARELEGFAPASPPDPGALALLGTWFWGPVEYRMRLGRDGRLELRGVPTARDCDFVKGADGAYVGTFGYFAGERLTWAPGDDGAARTFELASYVFTRAPYARDVEQPGGLDARGWHAP